MNQVPDPDKPPLPVGVTFVTMKGGRLNMIEVVDLNLHTGCI